MRRSAAGVLRPLISLFVLVGVACSDRAAEVRAPAGDAEGPLMVFAAASLSDVLREVGQRFQAQGGRRVELNFAGSNVLAKQIEAAHAADVFVSANEEWVSYLDKKGRLSQIDRRPLVENRLVVIARRDSPLTLARIADLPALPFSVLSLGDPHAVPAGKYAKRALSMERDAGGRTSWQAVERRVAPAPDVRAALLLVESDPRIVGIVYRTDARASQRVRVLLELPEGDPEARVRYQAAIVKGGRERAAQKLVDFLHTDPVRRIFERHGFARVVQPAEVSRRAATLASP